MGWEGALNDFYRPFQSKLSQAFKEAERVRIDLGTTEEKCPKCGGQLAIRMSKYGKFLACSNFPACRFTKNIVEKIDRKCPRCGADIILKKTRKGKQFYGCSAYPKCTFAAWKKEEIR
jgi:DNA topoisomerase-1